jgi:hypothetical protein
VVDSLEVGLLREEFGVEALEAQSQQHKGEPMGVPFLRHVMFLIIAEDHQVYPCLFLKLLLGSGKPLTEGWILI